MMPKFRLTDEMIAYLREISETASSNNERCRMFHKKFGIHPTADLLNKTCKELGIPSCTSHVDSYMNEEEKRWLLENYMNFPTLRSLAKDFGKRFRPKTTSNISIFLKNNGIEHVFVRRITNKQIEWIEEHSECSTYVNLTSEYNKMFGTDLTPNGFTSLCKRNGIHIKNDPAEVKKSLSEKKTKPIGHIAPTSQGYKRIKVEGGDKRGYMPLAQYVYEQAYGKIPEGYKIVYCDGNPSNASLDNLELVSNKVLGKIIHTEKSDDPNVRKTWAKLFTLEEVLNDN